MNHLEYCCWRCLFSKTTIPTSSPSVIFTLGEELVYYGVLVVVVVLVIVVVVLVVVIVVVVDIDRNSNTTHSPTLRCSIS